MLIAKYCLLNANCRMTFLVGIIPQSSIPKATIARQIWIFFPIQPIDVFKNILGVN